ncbi:MAG: hypothetical protein KIT56_06860 [Gammaproteobacteria bacterium]|nr:hypothetical protein [Gammaproteobacteria bacterium]
MTKHRQRETLAPKPTSERGGHESVLIVVVDTIQEVADNRDLKGNYQIKFTLVSTPMIL